MYAFCRIDRPGAPYKEDILRYAAGQPVFHAEMAGPGKSIVTDKVRPSNIWTRATYTRLMALYAVHPEQDLRYAVAWGESHSGACLRWLYTNAEPVLRSDLYRTVSAGSASGTNRIHKTCIDTW